MSFANICSSQQTKTATAETTIKATSDCFPTNLFRPPAVLEVVTAATLDDVDGDVDDDGRRVVKGAVVVTATEVLAAGLTLPVDPPHKANPPSKLE